MGQRLRNRRIQIGFRKGAIAAHLGVTTERFEEFEAGTVEIPHVLLGRLSDLMKVPVLYFFEDSFPTEASSRTAERPVNDEECLESLVSTFRSLDSDKKNYLVAFARALAQSA
jgi:transcriptional regulator with XRE-family HTH domain